MTGFVVILAPPRSFGSVVGAMLGQHPELYGLPETNLFVAETMAERAGLLAARPMADHGLLRAVAQLVVGEQTAGAVTKARRWLQARHDRSTHSVVCEITAAIKPRIPVDRSAATAEHPSFMQRARRGVEGVKFLHLVRHPFTQGQSLLRAGSPAAMLHGDAAGGGPARDPQRAWFSVHMNICTFLEGLPRGESFRVRGEDLLEAPDTHLTQIARWLGVRDDVDALDAMKHPERSPFAGFGPLTARFGSDPGFLRNARVRRAAGLPASLSGPLPWRSDGQSFAPEVVELARELGYA